MENFRPTFGQISPLQNPPIFSSRIIKINNTLINKTNNRVSFNLYSNHKKRYIKTSYKRDLLKRHIKNIM